jgi:hypothetical protein
MKRQTMRQLKIRFGSVMLFFGVFMGSSAVSEVREDDQMEISCWSGGHLVFYDIANTSDVKVGGSSWSGETTGGDKFAVQGDCVAVPVGYEG